MALRHPRSHMGYQPLSRNNSCGRKLRDNRWLYIHQYAHYHLGIIKCIPAYSPITQPDVLDHHKLSLTSNEKHALLLTGVVYAALAVVALVGLVGCLTEALGLLQVYEKVTWGFYLAQIGVAVWFIHAIFYNRKCLLWKCKHIVRIITEAK